MNGQSHHVRPAAGSPLFRALRWSAVPLVMAGCAASPSSTTAEADLNRALEDYRAGRYATAFQEAAAVQDTTSGEEHRDAAYVGGLAAYRLGDLAEAQGRLRLAADSETPRTAGNARAVLGLVLVDQGRPEEAAGHFAAASRVLDGDNARQAALHAAKAYERTGDEAAAEAWLRVAEGRAKWAITGSAPAGGAFTLQAGAYRQRPSAERAAVEAAAIAEVHGLSPVQIVPRRDERGDVLYVVQVGRFESRTAAVSARQRVGRLQYIVAALPPG
ncbi:MAG: SPOR domain-containing protein [Planctomycetota bacterium]